MYIYNRVIKMRDTDATGQLYFTNQLQIALECFEHFFHDQKIHLGEFLHTKGFLLPIVHTEADFFAPITLGDHLVVDMSLKELKERSFTLAFSLKKQTDEEPRGKVEITHVCVSKESKQAAVLPDFLTNLIKETK